MELTIQKLKDMSAKEIFATGTGTFPELTEEEIRWVAERGGYHDWCIYYGPSSLTAYAIAKTGTKCFTESVIKRLVPCDEEAYKFYRR